MELSIPSTNCIKRLFANVANPDNGRLFGQTAEQWKDAWLEGWRDGYDTNWEELDVLPVGLIYVSMIFPERK